MKEVLAKVRSEMQSRGFVEYFPAMAVWPFTPITVPRKPIEHLLRGQNRRNLLVALAKEGTITLLDHDKQPIDAHRFQWDVSRHPDDQVFIAPSDLEALVVGLLDAPKKSGRSNATGGRRKTTSGRGETTGGTGATGCRTSASSLDPARCPSPDPSNPEADPQIGCDAATQRFECRSDPRCRRPPVYDDARGLRLDCERLADSPGEAALQGIRLRSSRYGQVRNFSHQRAAKPAA